LIRNFPINFIKVIRQYPLNFTSYHKFSKIHEPKNIYHLIFQLVTVGIFIAKEPVVRDINFGQKHLEEEIFMSPKVAFPKKELNKWLKAHKTWDHDDWLKLLEDLKAKGFDNLVGDQAGQDSVGLYLETNRK
jgi:hypothetical protein